VVYYILKTPTQDRWSFLSLGLLLGGILGNFVDRLFHHYVFDFLTLHWRDQFAWPTFNLADSAISTGVAILLIKTVFDSRKHSTAAAILICFMLLPAPCRAQDAGSPDIDSLIEALQAKYERIESFSAEFVQTFSSRGIAMQEKGIVKMKRPGRMYWEYREPTRKFFIADGDKTYFYIPAENQVLVTDLDLRETESPLLFLLGEGNLQRDFTAEFEIPPPEEQTGPGSTIRLRLTPKVPHPDFTHLILEIEEDRYRIKSLTVVEPIGQQNEYALSNVQENIRIPDKQFRFKIPSRVEVIEQ